MYLDKQNEFADATAIGASTGRRLIGNVIDLGENVKDFGHGESAYLVIQVAVTATSAGSATVSFELVSDAQAAITTDGSATVHHVTEAIPVATLAAGYRVAVIKLPQGSYERYLGIIGNVGTAALTAGSIDAYLTPHEPKWLAHADGEN